MEEFKLAPLDTANGVIGTMIAVLFAGLPSTFMIVALHEANAKLLLGELPVLLSGAIMLVVYAYAPVAVRLTPEGIAVTRRRPVFFPWDRFTGFRYYDFRPWFGFVPFRMKAYNLYGTGLVRCYATRTTHAFLIEGRSRILVTPADPARFRQALLRNVYETEPSPGVSD